MSGIVGEQIQADSRKTIQRMYIFADRIDQVLDDLFESDSTAGLAGPVEPRPVSPADGWSSDTEMTAGDASFMPTVVAEPEPELPLLNLDALRRLAVRQAIARTDGHRGRAAELLGVSLNTMTRLVAECCPGNVAKVGRKRVNNPR